MIPLTPAQIRTNPVLCFGEWLGAHFRCENAPASRDEAGRELSKWVADGIALPTHAMTKWLADGCIDCFPANAREPSPRVVGVVLDEAREGLVNPLVTKPAVELTKSQFVPFAAQAIQSLLVRVCGALAPRIPGAIPEVFGFSFEESLQELCIGSSLDVAGLLSAIDALTGGSCERFAGACALVKPDQGDSLTEVGYAREKFEAFRREYGRGALLVISSSSPLAPEARSVFHEVWEVDSIAGLADKIGGVPGIAAKLAPPRSITPKQMGLVLARLRHLDEVRENKQAVDLCERVNASGFSDDVVLYDRIRVLKHESDALRHLGRHHRALKAADKIKSLYDDCPDVVSDEERLACAIDRAAALFDCCDFNGARDELASWLAVCDRDPRRFGGQKRVESFNTTARAMVMLQADDWECLFERSIPIQQAIDPGNIRRTEGYLIQGYCRSGRLDKADALLAKHEAKPTGDSFVDAFTRQFRCDLERRRGRLHPNNPEDLSFEPGYPRAFARLAMARQPGRTLEQAQRLLCEAREELEREAGGSDDSILRLISRAVALVEAAVANDRAAWCKASDQFVTHVRALGPSQCSYFAPAIARFANGPSVETAEQLLDLLPYI